MALASKACECAEIFGRWLDSEAGDDLLLQSIENRVFRFNLWATNNYIIAPTRASMDWRLRNAALLESTMSDLLDELKTNLIKVFPALQDTITSTGADDYTDVFHAVDKTLDDLFRLSRAIRRSGILRRFVKIETYIPDNEDDIALTEAFREGTQRIIDFRFRGSKASENLRNRVIDSICLRQQHFTYLRAKRAKNSGAQEVPVQKFRSRPVLSAKSSVTGPVASHALAKPAKITGHAPETGPSVMTATTAQPGRIPRNYAASSANEIKIHVVDHSDTDIPPPPKMPHNSNELECPYCFLVCSKQELSGRRWKRHIIQDLMPYICILEPCPTPGYLFESDQDWIGHMMSKHAVTVWTCMDSTHDETFFFHSDSDFKDHMHRHHPEQFDDDDLATISAACSQQLPQDMLIGECPFCPDEQKMHLNEKDMLKHVATHLLSLAQISLAGHDYFDGSQSAWSRSDRSPNHRLSQSQVVGSVAERLNIEFQDQVCGGGEYLPEYDNFIPPDALPDENAEQCQALWEHIRKPTWDPRSDPTLRSFVARFEQASRTPCSSSFSHHWAQDIFPTARDIVASGRCYGESNPDVSPWLDTRSDRLLELTFNGSYGFRLLIYLTEDKLSTQIACTKARGSQVEEYSSQLLNSLEIFRADLSIHLCQSQGYDGLLVWTFLTFATIEDLILFFCTFLALRSHGYDQRLEFIRDHELGGEEELFEGKIFSGKYLHTLRLYKDIFSGVIRLQASVGKAGVENAPIWTAFISENIAAHGWIRLAKPKLVMLRDLQPTFFTSPSDIPSLISEGEYCLEFTNMFYARDFIEAIADLRSQRLQKAMTPMR